MSFWSKLFNRNPQDKRRFQNEQSLPLKSYGYKEISQLDLAAFPTVEDFTVKLTPKSYYDGIQLYFYSEQRGRLATFPVWDNVDKRISTHGSRVIPDGNFEDPFQDLDQGWEILVFSDENFVYILQGDDPNCRNFQLWFKVPRERYFNEWMRVIRQFNPDA